MADEDAQAEPKPAKRGRKGMQLLVVVLLMVGEGVAVYLLADSFSEVPAAAVAAGGEAGGPETGVPDLKELAEVELAECRPSNKMSGKFITFHIRVTGLVAAADAERAEKLAEGKQARILDRVNFVVRSADPKHLNEPALETVKRRLKQEFDQIFEDDELIKGVLIPQMLQSGSGV
jgi:hypothetical protein